MPPTSPYPKMQPIRFAPLYQPRVWGGRHLETDFGRTLPEAKTPYGESWEIVDRPEAQSIVISGNFQGKSLQELWNKHRSRLFGEPYTEGRWSTVERFPLLAKILDAKEKLSVQVHPPAHVAGILGGEPKTEMWYVVGAETGAEIYVGLRNGCTPENFFQAIDEGTTERMLHRVVANVGDSIFLPSGRIHAIGAGLRIIEFQQNSDTTYRVFDWNRKGLDGSPRTLHIQESMKSIDFTDIEPDIDRGRTDIIADCPYFRVKKHTHHQHESIKFEAIAPGSQKPIFQIGAVAAGAYRIQGFDFTKGDFFLLPAIGSPPSAVAKKDDSILLLATVPI